MKEVRVEDEDGEGMNMWEHEDIYYPPLPGIDQLLDRLPEFKARTDDVLIIGYPRSGTNWVWEVINMLKTGKTEHLNTAKIECMLEYKSLEHLDALASPRVLNTHLRHGDIPAKLVEMGCKMIYVLRNVKDVSVSIYNFQRSYALTNYNGAWKGYNKLFNEGKVMYGSWFSFVKDWARALEAHPELPVLIVPYEELKMDFSSLVRKIAAFLGVTYEDDLYAMVEERCNFQTLKSAKDEIYTAEERAVWKGGKPEYLRKGDIGDWKNWYTVAQNEHMDALIEKNLTDFPIKLVYE